MIDKSKLIPLPAMKDTEEKAVPSHTDVVVGCKITRDRFTVFTDGNIRMTLVIGDPDHPELHRRVQATLNGRKWTLEKAEAVFPAGTTFIARADLYPPREQLKYAKDADGKTQRDADGEAILERDVHGNPVPKINKETGKPYYNQTLVLHEIDSITRPPTTAIDQLAEAAKASAAPKADAAEEL